MMYRWELVPTRIAMLGLVGGPLVCITGVAVLIGVDEPTVWGLRAAPILTGSGRLDAPVSPAVATR
jgi:hypothetical protein